MHFSISFISLLVYWSSVSAQNFNFEFGLEDEQTPEDSSFTSSNLKFSRDSVFSRRSSDVASRPADRTNTRGFTRTLNNNNQNTQSKPISSFSFSGLDEPVVEQFTPLRKVNNRRGTQVARTPAKTSSSIRRPTKNENPVRILLPRGNRRNDEQVRLPQTKPEGAVERGSSRQKISRQSQFLELVNPEENEITEDSIGKSPCARGSAGHTCRLQLIQTALSCTSGKCHKCQNCDSVAPAGWISCCRDHFLCCRPLARTCQRCDQPSLQPFCNIAFGKCY